MQPEGSPSKESKRQIRFDVVHERLDRKLKKEYLVGTSYIIIGSSHYLVAR